jgi:hypothetical protein
MGIRTKGGLGKLSGTATIIRKDGTREEVPFTTKASKTAVDKLIAARAAKKKQSK